MSFLYVGVGKFQQSTKFGCVDRGLVTLPMASFQPQINIKKRYSVIAAPRLSTAV